MLFHLELLRRSLEVFGRAWQLWVSHTSGNWTQQVTGGPILYHTNWRVYDWTHVFASFVMETTSEWKVWPKDWRSTRRDLQGPSQTFHRAMVSMTNLVWACLGWLPFRTPSVSCHFARLNIGSTLQRSAKVTWHCTVALHCLLAFQCASLSVSNGPHHTWKRLRLGQFLCVK